MNLGKAIRMERIKDRDTGNTVIVPIDHGITSGPIAGIIDIRNTVNAVADGGANAVLMHKGVARAGHRRYGKDIGLVLHISASTSLGPNPLHKVQVASVAEALKLGADAVSIHINIGAESEPEMLREFGNTASECEEWGMPLVAMMYPRSEKERDEHNVDLIKHVARVGAELGADIVKTNYTGNPDDFREVTNGCPVPVVIAGGPKVETDVDLLEMVKGAMNAGAKGVSIGRNIFQHENPAAMTRAIAMIVHGNVEVEEASSCISHSG